MLPYFVLVGMPGLITLYSRFSQKNNQIKIDYENNNSTINCFFIIWLLLLSLRSEAVGCDLNDYKNIISLEAARSSFSEIFSNAFNLKTDIGFGLLSKIIYYFSTNFRWLMIADAVLAIVPIWRLYRKEAVDYPFLTIAVFMVIGLFPMYFSGMRQILAMAFVVPAYYYTKKKKIFPFLLMVFLAFMFHRSALIIGALYPVYWMRTKKKVSFIPVSIAIIVCFVSRVSIFGFLSKYIEDIYDTGISATGAIGIYLLLVLFTVFSYIIPDEDKIDDSFIGLRNLLVFSTIIQTFAGLHTLSMRMNYYYLIFVPIVIPKVIKNTSRKFEVVSRYALHLMIVFFVLFYFYNAYTGNDILRLYPYYPFWSNP